MLRLSRSCRPPVALRAPWYGPSAVTGVSLHTRPGSWRNEHHYEYSRRRRQTCITIMTRFDPTPDEETGTRDGGDRPARRRSIGWGNRSRRKNELLAVLREMHGKGFQAVSARGIARYLHNRHDPGRIGALLSSLAAEGYVERIGDESPYRYTLRDEQRG